MVAEQTALTRLRHGVLQALDRQRVLRTHVDDRLPGADCIRADEHALDQVVRVALNNCAIHERTGVALIRVADEGLFRTGCTARGIPLEPCWEAGAAAPFQAGDLDLLNHLFGCHRGEHLFNGLIAVICQIVVNIFRIDNAAVPQCNPRLLR